MARTLNHVNYKCLFVNTDHDSIVFDVHPDEVELMISFIDGINNSLNDIIYKAYGVVFNVPLLLEAKIGNNWLDQKDVSKR